MRFILRVLGTLALAVAFAAVVVDGTRSVAAQDLLAFTFGDTLAWMRPGGLAWLDQAGQSSAAPAAAALLLSAILHLPTSIVALILGGVLLVLGRKPAPRFGPAERSGTR